MENKERIELKRKLREISKSEYPIDNDTYNFFLETVNEVNPTQKEMINMIHNLMKFYYLDENDIELNLADFLLNKITNENLNHYKLSSLYYVAICNNCIPVFEMLLIYNIPVIQEVYDDLNEYVKNLEEYRFMNPFVNFFEVKDMFEDLTIHYRKNKIEHLKSNIAASKQVV